jgi:allantoicase
LPTTSFSQPKENLLKPAACDLDRGKIYRTAASGWTAGRPCVGAARGWKKNSTGASFGWDHQAEQEAVTVDTSFFRGNFPSHCSIGRLFADPKSDVAELLGGKTRWTEILGKSALFGDTQNNFAIDSAERVTHVRLKIFPDGGVARLRIYGDVLPDWDSLKRRGQ